MKIALVSINSKYIHSSLGVWYLYAAAKKINTNHDIQIIEATINQNPNDLIDEILSQGFDVVGFSSYIWNIDFIHKTAQVIKQLSNKTKIFLGGPEASYDSIELIKKPYIDFIIKNEGEKAFMHLLENDFNTKENEIIFMGMTEYINPYTDEYFAALNGRIAYVETSRGCPFSCSFCLSGIDETVRFFEFNESMQNIIKLANSNVQTIKFVDRTFNCNDKRALEIFKFILNEYENNNIPKDIVFHFEVEAELFSKETLEFLKTVPVGLFQFEAGLQSFNPKTLKATRRNEKIEKLVYNLKEIAKMKNIHLHIDLIAGLPFEDYESFKSGFNLAYEIKSDVIQLGFLKLLKGSHLKTQEKEHEFITQEYSPYQVMQTKYISYNELSKLQLVEDVTERLLNSQRYVYTLQYLLNTLNYTPFDLFFIFSEEVKRLKIKNPSLDLYSKTLYEFFINFNEVDKDVLRDTLAKDFILTNKTGKLPKFLHVFDDRLKTISNFVKTNDKFNKEMQAKMKAANIGIAILYTENKVILADYTKKNPVKNYYEYTIFDMDVFYSE